MALYCDSYRVLATYLARCVYFSPYDKMKFSGLEDGALTLKGESRFLIMG